MAQPPARYDPPLPQTPMVDETGGVTQPWLMYFIGAQRFWTAALVSLGITPQNLQNPPAVAGSVTAETAARIAADAALEAQLAAEAGARAAADASEADIRRRDDFEVRAQNVALAASVTDEKAARIAADETETAARIAADEAETAARIAGDAGHVSSIYAPLCTGDVPPVLVGTVDGQAIMVPIT